MKVCYLDVETTGIDAVKYDIIQLAMILEIDGKVEKTFCFDIKAVDPTVYDRRALNVHNTSVEALSEGYEPLDVHKSLVTLLDKYVDRYNKADKFFLAGYNTRFDAEHLSNFFRKCDDKYYGSYFNWQLVDGMSMVYNLVYMGALSLPNYQLGEVCKHFGIPLKDKHNALADLKATKLLIHKLTDIFKIGVDHYGK